MKNFLLSFMLFAIMGIFTGEKTLEALGRRAENPEFSKKEKDPHLNPSPKGWTVPDFTTEFSKISVDPAEILSGGPPKDGIPSIDSPRYVSTEEARTWLSQKEPVLLVRVGKEARIYPLQILVWHEIVNDQIADMPLTITFCPLCNTGVVFRRVQKGVILDFGTTGRLRKSNLIMYDRQTESWWQQATGKAIIGEYLGSSLDFYPALTLSFADAQKTAPQADVLSKETGYSRPYGQNPYQRYDAINNVPFLYRGPIDDSMAAMDRVLVVKIKQKEQIFSYSELQKKRVINIELDSTALVIFWTLGTASALDSPLIAEGRDVGSANVFYRLLEGEELDFSASKEKLGNFVDSQTGSLWNGRGQAIEGSLSKKELKVAVGIQHFWFSAQAFAQDGEQ